MGAAILVLRRQFLFWVSQNVRVKTGSIHTSCVLPVSTFFCFWRSQVLETPLTGNPSPEIENLTWFRRCKRSRARKQRIRGSWPGPLCWCHLSVSSSICVVTWTEIQFVLDLFCAWFAEETALWRQLHEVFVRTDGKHPFFTLLKCFRLFLPQNRCVAFSERKNFCTRAHVYHSLPRTSPHPSLIYCKPLSSFCFLPLPPPLRSLVYPPEGADMWCFWHVYWR